MKRVLVVMTLIVCVMFVGCAKRSEACALMDDLNKQIKVLKSIDQEDSKFMEAVEKFMSTAMELEELELTTEEQIRFAEIMSKSME